eukprot:TRINITY_DN55489_c0_g1_i1.p1 TRINITY_DN55489_c0_g1~~TRINITY_DN55489_c0_g1_i1.p1  ORF type:complete len:411 (-),score=65.99 TRINITY_DN55489_c0_g1_i1:104-1270(-)
MAHCERCRNEPKAQRAMCCSLCHLRGIHRFGHRGSDRRLRRAGIRTAASTAAMSVACMFVSVPSAEAVRAVAEGVEALTSAAINGTIASATGRATLMAFAGKNGSGRSASVKNDPEDTEISAAKANKISQKSGGDISASDNRSLLQADTVEHDSARGDIEPGGDGIAVTSDVDAPQQGRADATIPVHPASKALNTTGDTKIGVVGSSCPVIDGVATGCTLTRCSCPWYQQCYPYFLDSSGSSGSRDNLGVCSMALYMLVLISIVLFFGTLSVIVMLRLYFQIADSVEEMKLGVPTYPIESVNMDGTSKANVDTRDPAGFNLGDPSFARLPKGRGRQLGSIPVADADSCKPTTSSLATPQLAEKKELPEGGYPEEHPAIAAVLDAPAAA